MRKTKSATLWILLVIVLIIGFGIFTFGVLKETEKNTNILYISKSTKEKIDNTVDRKEIIVGIQIVGVDYRRNIREEEYVSIGDSVVNGIYLAYKNNRIAETPLFTKEKIINDRIIRLLSGEFICVPFVDSLAYRYAPAAATVIDHICALGIPPRSYGDLKGMITIYMNKTPTLEEKSDMFNIARDLSNMISEENIE